MGRKATPDAGGGRGGDKGSPGRDDKLDVDLHDAWRLAFVVVSDGDLATKAVTKAFVDASPGDATSLPSRVELLEATLRISLTRAAESPDRETDSAVVAALWLLPAGQRAALWLAKVDQLDNSMLGAVLGLGAPEAGQVARRAGEWLDVALDQDSGPLCEFETELADFIDETLPRDEAKELDEHLPGCPTCRTKLRAREELADLPSVLEGAVPAPPKWLTIEALELAERNDPSDGVATLAEAEGRTPAVRPLAACCVALLIVAVVGIAVVRPGRHSADPASTSDPHAVLPNLLSPSESSGGLVGTSADLPGGSATTITITTTSIPAVTFPTVPGRKGKP